MIPRPNHLHSASRNRGSVRFSKSKVLVHVAGSRGGEAGNVLGCPSKRRGYEMNNVECREKKHS